MTLEKVVELTQLLELTDGKEAGFGPSGVQDRSSMTLF